MAEPSSTANLDGLLSAHADAITALRTALGSELPVAEKNSTVWDDIWLLRYVLSFDSLAKREESVRKCVAWRKDHAEMLSAAAAGETHAKHAAIAPYCIASYHFHGSKFAEPVYVVRAGLHDAQKLLSSVSGSDFLDWLMFQKELAFITCDAQTRKQRVLVKGISVIDLSGSQFRFGAQ
jgi:hypothetical protein